MIFKKPLRLNYNLVKGKYIFISKVKIKSIWILNIPNLSQIL